MSSKKTVFWLAFLTPTGAKHVERALFFDQQFAMHYADKLAKARGSYDNLVVYRREPSGEVFLNEATISSIWVKLNGRHRVVAERDLQLIKGSYSPADAGKVEQ